MKDKINYIEAMKLYFNNTKHQISKIRYNDGRYGRRNLFVIVPVESTAKQRKNRIVLSYLFILIFSVVTMLMLFINVLFLILGLILIGILVLDLLTTLNFTFIRILRFKNLYNDNSNPYKILLKELYNYNSIEKVLDIKSQYTGLNIIDYTPSYTLKEKKYYIQKNKTDAKLFINRYSVNIFNDESEIIINDDGYSLDELKKIILDEVNNSLINIPKNYKWVYMGNINKKDSFKAYNIKTKFKKLYKDNKELCITEKTLPNVKKGSIYRFLVKTKHNGIQYKHYSVLLAKLDDNNFAMFEKHEC